MDYDVTQKTECVAAFFIDHAQTNTKKGGLQLSIDDLPELGMSALGIRFDKNIVDDAISLLVDLGFGEIISVGKTKPYFLIDPNIFSRTNKRNWYAPSTLSLLDDGLQTLRAFRKLGSLWLIENAKTIFEEEFLAEKQRQDRFFDAMTRGLKQPTGDMPTDYIETAPTASSGWTGLPAHFQLTEEIQTKLVSDLDRAEAALGGIAISQQERSQARAYIIAIRVLAEAPEPQADLIWEILGRANQISGIASLFVSIMALFVSVVN